MSFYSPVHGICDQTCKTLRKPLFTIHNRRKLKTITERVCTELGCVLCSQLKDSWSHCICLYEPSLKVFEPVVVHVPAASQQFFVRTRLSVQHFKWRVYEPVSRRIFCCSQSMLLCLLELGTGNQVNHVTITNWTAKWNS